MPKNSKKSLPTAMKISEASAFWDEHNLFQFEGTKEVKVNFKLKKKHYVGIDHEMYKKVEAQARRQKQSVETLLASWIAEKTASS